MLETCYWPCKRELSLSEAVCNVDKGDDNKEDLEYRRIIDDDENVPIRLLEPVNHPESA
jgi:hypothetical protein